MRQTRRTPPSRTRGPPGQLPGLLNSAAAPGQGSKAARVEGVPSPPAPTAARCRIIGKGRNASLTTPSSPSRWRGCPDSSQSWPGATPSWLSSRVARSPSSHLGCRFGPALARVQGAWRLHQRPDIPCRVRRRPASGHRQVRHRRGGQRPGDVGDRRLSSRARLAGLMRVSRRGRRAATGSRARRVRAGR
jgi:hypothetical protein